MVRYYAYYRNVCRGKRKKSDQDDLKPYILEPETNSAAYRKNWARLTKKIYEVEPLTCPKCQGQMRIVSFIEDQQVVKKYSSISICDLVKSKPPPRANAPPVGHHIDYAETQFPSYDNYNIDPIYPIDSYAL